MGYAFNSKKCVIFLVSLTGAHMFFREKNKTDRSFSLMKIFLFYENNES